MTTSGASWLSSVFAVISRTKKVRTTTPTAESERPADLVDRVFTAVGTGPPLGGRPHVCPDPGSGFCYTAFIIDAFSRRIVGWRVSSSLRTDLALDALEMAIWSRGGGDLDGSRPSFSDQGCPIPRDSATPSDWRTPGRSTRWDRRVIQLRQCPRGDRQRALQGRAHQPTGSLAECRARRVRDRRLGPSGGTHERLHGACGDYVPPAEYETAYWADQQVATLAA